MNSIQNQPMAAGTHQKYPSLSDAQVASYMKKQSVSSYQSLNAGLTIQTKEGDLVTLNSSSYSQLDAYSYNSKGILQTENGLAVVSQSQREITLSSGESFTFSVQGELSEEELDDIEEIIQGIDDIIAEMAEGDMDEAVEKAMSMGSYDTVSMYAADISMESTYQRTTETQAQAAAIDAAPAPELLPKEEPRAMPAIEPFPENHAPKKRRKNSIQEFSQFVEKMMNEMEKHEDKQVARSKKAVDKLFDHHLKGMEKDDDDVPANNAAFAALEGARDKMDKFIDKIAGRLFESQMSSFLG